MDSGITDGPPIHRQVEAGRDQEAHNPVVGRVEDYGTRKRRRFRETPLTVVLNEPSGHAS